MDYVLIIYLSPIVAALAWVAWQIFLDRLRDKAVSQISDESFLKLVDELQNVGSIESKSFFLKARKQKPCPNPFRITLPPQMDVKWLKGAQLLISLSPDPQSEDQSGSVEIVNDAGVEPDIELIPIPRIGFKNGGGANQYKPSVWFKRNHTLYNLAKVMYPRDPEGFVWCLFHGVGRLNAPFEWLQTPPRLRCKTCSKKLLPVLQVGGASVGLSREIVYYIAACPQETGSFRVYSQLT